MSPVWPKIEIVEARPEDAAAIAELHLSSRRAAMPYLHLAHTDDETRDHFARTVRDRPGAWWVARHNGQVAGYMLIDGDDLDHLYVDTELQRCGIGRALLAKAKALSPQRIALLTFQRNSDARAFYEAHGFRASGFTDGHNEENEPDVCYVWEGGP